MSTNIVKLLEHGATGVLVVLVYFTFLLIKQEQQRKEPREKMFKVIKAFGVMCTVIDIIAIGISIYQYESEKIIRYNRENLTACQDSLERLHTYILSNLIDPEEVKSYVQSHYEKCNAIFVHVAD